MTASKFTKRAIDSFTYRGGWDVRWDSEVPGLGVRIYPSGKKSFVLRYSAAGRKRMMVLGLFGVDLTLDEARTRAGKLRGTVRDGADPLEARKAARARGRPLSELLAEYVADRKAHGKKTAWKDARRFELYLPESLKVRPACDITHADMARLHKDLAHVPYEANRVLETLRHAFRLGRHWDFCLDPAVNPAADIERYPEQKRKVWVQPHELPFLAEAIDLESSIYVRGLLWLYLLTAARKSELLTAKRHDVDMIEGRLRLPETKSGEEQSLTLSSHALAVIETLPAMAKNPYLFPSTSKAGGHLVNISKPWARVRERATMALWSSDPTAAGLIAAQRERLVRAPKRKHAARIRTEPTVRDILESARREGVELPPGFLHVRLHDLRRTAGSWLTSEGVDLNTIKEGLRHALISTTLRYARLAQDATRPAFEEHGQRVREAARRAGPVGVGTGNG